MKGTLVYQVFLKPVKDGYYAVRIPDIEQYTQGTDLANAIFMARDCIGSYGNYCEDINEKIPMPFSKECKAENDEIATFIDIDFDKYRAMHKSRYVKKNCTIPAYLEEAAEERGLNFSRILAEALAEKLKYAID